MKKFLSVVTAIVMFFLFSAELCLAADNRFVSQDEQTVVDTTTGLMWAIHDNGEDIDWQGAKKYCENYTAGGHSDWRMPTLQELMTIFDHNSAKRFKSYDPIALTGSCPWSSDERRHRARTLFFMVGEVNTFPKELSQGCRALPVRKAE